MHALDIVCMSETTAPEGLLVRVQEKPDFDLALDEKIAIRAAAFLYPSPPTHVLFRRFSDGRSSQVAAYVVDNEVCQYSKTQLALLHQNVWLSGATPLLYVANSHEVSIFSCAKAAVYDSKKRWKSEPQDVLSVANEVEELAKRKQYSSYRLIDGTFWEDPRNARLVNAKGAAHTVLIEKVRKADNSLKGKENPVARHLLLLTLLLKYLEDRNVIKPEWFGQYVAGATSCIYVYEKGGRAAALAMLQELESRFNGDIFALSENDKSKLSDGMLKKLAEAVDAGVDSRGQLYFWNIFSFEHIPIEVLSHIYQQFADKDEGAIFTPPFVVNLLLDYAMPLASLKGTETVFDPACGSGIFLVSAFRRLVQARLAQKNWETRLSPPELKKLLAESIFGCELQQTAAELTAFSLALAVCDALQPDVIWEELQFDKLLYKNILIGDFSENISEIKEKTLAGKGFDIILGNPPFMSRLTESMARYAKQKNFTVPGRQAAYLFLKACLCDILAQGATLCMIQNAGFIYNEGTKKFKKYIFDNFQFEAVLDFVSIRGLFQGADPKAVAVLVRKIKPTQDYFIKHLTFRRTKAAEGKMYFELDYYDHHSIVSTIASQHIWVWKANLLGGGRCFALAKRLSEMPTLNDYVQSQGWKFGVGLKEGYTTEEVGFLMGKTLLPTTALTSKGIDQSKLQVIESAFYAAPRTEEHFTKPLFLIHQNEKLYCAYWDKDDLVYKHKIAGVYGAKNTASALKNFSTRFALERKRLCAALQLLGAQALVGKATAINKKDIERLPWPRDCDWSLIPWEEDLLADINEMSKYVRLGQKSTLLKNAANDSHIQGYQETFLRLMRTSFPDMEACGSGHSDGLRYQAFSFSKAGQFTWEREDWANFVRKTIFCAQGDTHSFMSIRLFRYYSEEYVILIKPDRLRYWLRSSAIRDVDDTVVDIMREVTDYE